MALGVPRLIQPAGPRSPYDPFSMKFPEAGDAPDRYDIQSGTDPAFGTIDLWHATQQTAGLVGRRVDAPYAGPAPTVGVSYYWRARGRLGATLGPWSLVQWFIADPTAVSAPYASWARDVLAVWSKPRPLIVVGSLLPTGAQVLQLLGTEYAGRWQVRDDSHPPSTDQIVAVYGLTFHVDAESGWEVAGMTSDAPAEIP